MQAASALRRAGREHGHSSVTSRTTATKLRIAIVGLHKRADHRPGGFTLVELVEAFGDGRAKTSSSKDLDPGHQPQAATDLHPHL